MKKVTSWNKFTLLLWKNWVLQWSHKLPLLIEIFLPALFTLLLVLIRALVVPEPTDEKGFDPVPIDNLDLFNSKVGNLRKFLALAKAFAKSKTKSFSLPDIGSITLKPKMTVAYSPSNQILDTIVSTAANSLGLQFVAADNASAMETLVMQNNFFAGIEFDESLANLSSTTGFHKFDFALRFPSELRTINSKLQFTWFTNKLFPQLDFTGPRNRDSDDGGVPVGYLREGFLPLQHALSMAYLKIVSGVSDLPYVEMQRYPYPAYIYDPLLEGLGGLIPFFIIISFIYPSILVTKYVTLEKEKQLKEVMKIMGLSNWLHWAAWFVKAISMFAISIVFVTIFFKVKWDGEVAVFTYCSWSVLYVFLLVYVISFICFCFMMATFFSKASTAGAITSIVMFVAYVPFIFLVNNYDDLTLGTKLGWSLITNTAVGFAFRVFSGFEGTGEGVQWYNLFTPVSVDDDLSLGAIMLVMLAASVLYMLVCLYVEQIFPGDFGVPKKWYFPFTSEFWCGSRDYSGVHDISANADSSRSNKDAFEVEPVGKPVGVQVRSLKKTFGKKTVVKGISMNMYENEITVLLGHNGAGKTTTISMLTGMCPPTAGTAVLNGSDIRSNIEGARMSLGICPQHNVLFDDMSVENHLRFFSRLKGLKGKDVDREVEKYLRMIELENKAKVASSKLSGGMKRKLSLCCALAGDTKVVLCDEPSSGMDPSARRQLWDLLQAEKAGRTILLTTHFMDEADVLGDRIAIMCNGELKCHGTSFFLKKKFGSGYRLICVKRENCEAANVTKLLSKYVPNIQPESDIGSELTYQLSDEYSYVFKNMFSDLENNSERLLLSGYGIGITSMEEVFMKVGSENAIDGTRKSHNVVMNGGTGFHDDDAESDLSDRVFTQSTRLLKGRALYLNQWQAMFLKKILFTWRKKVIFLLQSVLPIFFVILTILVGRSLGGFNTLPRMTVSVAQYPQLVTVLATNDSVISGSVEEGIAKQYSNIAQSYGSERTFEAIGMQSFQRYILDLGKTIQVRVDSRYLVAATVGKGRITAWLNNQPYHTAPLTVNLVHNAMAKQFIDPNAEITVTNAPLPFSIDTLVKQLDTGNNIGTQFASNMCLCMSFLTPLYLIFMIKERESRAKLLQFVGGVRVWTFWLTQLLWDWATLTMSVLLGVITLACFQEPGFATFPELARVFFVMFLFSYAVLPLTYLLSLLFTEPASGYARVSLVNIFLGVALFSVVLIIGSPLFDLKDVADVLQFIFLVFPHFSLAFGLNNTYTNSKSREICLKIPEFMRCTLRPSCCPPTPFFAWDEPGMLAEILYLVIFGTIYFLMLIVFEYGFIKKFFLKLQKLTFGGPPPRPEEITHSDEDVQVERDRILAMSSNEVAAQNLVLDRVTKYYKKFLAVDQISLCVKSGETFGLLGVNGAGKTTTFKMMTGDESITYGAAFVKGNNISSEMSTIYKDIGYCPQFDALLEDLTGREILKIFSLIRGVRRQCINDVSVELAKLFGFMKHIDKPTKAYSGGNKRKLSAAIAVLGNPSVIYMDEPTTGIDPAARRQLWNVLCHIRDTGKSIVLTSHSMEECEALCTRLAIMVNGEFKCIGSTQHLKNKFSKGLILKIKVKRNEDLVRKTRDSANFKDDELSVPAQLLEKDIVNVKEFVTKEFPQAILQEEYQGILTFYIPLASIKWSEIFGLMEENRSSLNIEDYSISQTTLEEIFLEFAKLQREDPRANNEDDHSCSCLKRRRRYLNPNVLEVTSI